jgi:acetyl-CoA carboxylase, biotin carboxylase subunit
VRTTLPFARWLMDQPRYIAGDFSTDFIAEEWGDKGRLKASAAAASEAPTEIDPAQVAALVGALLMHEHTQDEQARRRPVSEETGESSPWRMAGRMESVRRI